MREAIGGTWVMQLVIIFMLIFVAFLALSLNYSKAFQMKNEMLSIIEKYEGVNDKSITIINNYLSKNGYNVKNSCPRNSYGVKDLSNNSGSKVNNNNKDYYYCIQKIKSPSEKHSKKAFYRVNISFYFNLPVIGDIFKFTIEGNTNDVVRPNDTNGVEAIEG